MADFVLQLLQEYLVECLVDVVHLDFIRSVYYFGSRRFLLVLDVFHLVHD